MRVVKQGSIRITSEPYCLLEQGSIVCFRFDVCDDLEYAIRYSYSEDKCPMIEFESGVGDVTTVVFENYQNYRVFSFLAYKSISVTLIREEVYNDLS